MSHKHKHKNNSECTAHENNCTLLYNPRLLSNPHASLLSGDILQQASESEKISNAGRGQAWFIEFDGLAAVYRKYMRGGLVAKLNRQTYISPNLQNTRSIKEWHLLQWMFDRGLPVPQPIAASACRWPFSFSPFYRAQILVQRIADVKTLDQLLTERKLEPHEWRGVGECIRQFHDAGIYHADLNANNILLDKNSKVYLIDFDKGERRKAMQKNSQWMQNNLQRLKRSLLKQQRIRNNYFFTEENWQLLLVAYN